MRQETTPFEIPTITWVVELPAFIFLACLANPFNIVFPDRGAAVVLCLIAWLLFSKRYSIWELCKHLGRPPARILRWVYFGALIVTGWQWVSESETSLLRPVRYSVHYYFYGIEEDYDDEGRATATASHVVCKGPYPLDGNRGYDGSKEVPDENRWGAT